jgi:hypothetical protein
MLDCLSTKKVGSFLNRLFFVSYFSGMGGLMFGLISLVKDVSGADGKL